jgi:hypothetical protein
MAMLDTNNVHYSQVLTNVSLAWKNDIYVADRLIPTVKSNDITGIYYKRGRENFQIDQAYRRPGTPSNTISHEYSQDSYATEPYGLNEILPDRVVKAATTPIKAKSDAVEVLTEKLKLAKEKAVVDIISDYTTTFASYRQTLATYNGATNPDYVYLNDWTNADPCYIIGLIRDRVQQQCGRTPNTIAMNPKLENVIANHPKTKERFQYTQSLNSNSLPDNFLGFSNFVRVKAVRDTQNPGQSTPTTSWLFPDVLFIGYVEPSPGLWKTSVGYSFEYEPLNVWEWYENKLRATIVEVNWEYVIKVVDAKCGFVVYNCLIP